MAFATGSMQNLYLFIYGSLGLLGLKLQMAQQLALKSGLLQNLLCSGLWIMDYLVNGLAKYHSKVPKAIKHCVSPPWEVMRNSSLPFAVRWLLQCVLECWNSRHFNKFASLIPTHFTKTWRLLATTLDPICIVSLMKWTSMMFNGMM